MNTLPYIFDRFGLTIHVGRMPWNISGFGRSDLARLFCELGFTTGAEIGVEQGLYTEVLCQANPQAKIYAVDAWQAYSGYREHVSQMKLDGFYEDARARLAPYNCKIIREFSPGVARWFGPNELDFVFIDANHEFQHLTNDIAEWSRRVRPGGIIAGHDFKRTKNQSFNHTVDVVQAWTYAYRISPWFVLRGDRAASWMWVKEQK